MRPRRILVLSHEDLVAPESLDGLSAQERHEIKTEWDVVTTLRHLGHAVRQLGVSDDLRRIRRVVESWQPHVVFNLLEEFQGEAVYDHNVVAYLELLQVAHTGCGPRGLVLARDKSLAKKLMAYHRIRVPRFFVVRRGRMPRLTRGLAFPLIVKSLVEEASMAIAKASVVRSDDKLVERVQFVHEHVATDAIVEEFIPGREIYVAVLGNQRLQVLPPQELVIGDLAEGEPLIATEKVKHDPRYQDQRRIDVVAAELDAAQRRVLERVSRRAYRVLELRGYGRIDFRLSPEGEVYFLEANPNPDLAEGEEVASAALGAGIDYPALLQKVVSLGMRARR
jgi:D-alanine-D-alanine ligase